MSERRLKLRIVQPGEGAHHDMRYSVVGSEAPRLVVLRGGTGNDAGGPKGWRGDVALSRMDSSAIEGLGFRVSLSSDFAARRAAREVARKVFG